MRPRTTFPGVLAAFSILVSLGIVFLSPGGTGNSFPAQSATSTADLAGTTSPATHIEDDIYISKKTSARIPEYSSEVPAAQKAARAKEWETGRRSIVIVIDDAGYSLAQLEAFLELPFPLTIAVLPGLAHSAEAAARIQAAGKELILHQPMQARNGEDPGPGAILLGMTDVEIESIMEKNMDSVPGIVGINNHMGSAVTENVAIMTSIMELAKKRGIYYLDSLTTSGSTTREIASRIKLIHWERDVFLDNAPDRVSILRAMDEGKKIASSSGVAVMIGHVWSADLAQTLMEIYPGLVEEGYSLSSIARFMMNQSDPEDDDDAGFGN